MDDHIIVMPPVSAELGRVLGREAALVALMQLRANVIRHRSRRDPDDERLFDYVLVLCDAEERWQTLRFSVDDTTAQGVYLVVAVSHSHGKAR